MFYHLLNLIGIFDKSEENLNYSRKKNKKKIKQKVLFSTGMNFM